MQIEAGKLGVVKDVLSPRVELAELVMRARAVGDDLATVESQLYVRGLRRKQLLACLRRLQWQWRLFL